LEDATRRVPTDFPHFIQAVIRYSRLDARGELALLAEQRRRNVRLSMNSEGRHRRVELVIGKRQFLDRRIDSSREMWGPP